MKALVVGASGATGRLLVEQLLERGAQLRVVVRSAQSLPRASREHPNLALTEASLLDLSAAEIQGLVEGCDAVASCLGHNLTFKGLFGQPRRLVTDATARLCAAVHERPGVGKVRFVLMNTTANRNRDLEEPRSVAERLVFGLLSKLLPPQADNEQAAEHLRTSLGKEHAFIEWVAVRPDGLTDEPEVTPYVLHPSPIRSPVFDAGKTSRINVANFMARLMLEDELWQSWVHQMPVIYNADSAVASRR